METRSTSMRELAQLLLALEAARGPEGDAPAHEALRVCETLRLSLTRFAGADGFTALLRRALILARADVPALENVQVNPDGRIEGLERLMTDAENRGAEAALAITAHLLTLLATFIGEPLTLRLVRNAWPNVSLDE